MGLKRREDLSARSGVDVRRMARQGAGSLVYTLATLAALAFVLAAGTRFRTTWDFTRQHANSLAPKTIEALDALSEPVEIHALFKERDPKREGYWDLLNLYRRHTARVSVEFVDPNSRPAIVGALGLSKEEQSALKDGITVVTRGARKVVFRGRGEEDVTNAILEVGSDAPRVVGFLRGVGERDPASTADAGMSAAADALRREYYEVVDVRLDAPIPPSVGVLVAAGPRAAIPREALLRVATWLEHGGRLLLLLDGDYDSGLGEVAARWGVRGKNVKVLDPRQNLRGQPEVPLSTEFSRHPIVRGFSASLPLALPLPVAVEDYEPGDPAVYHEWLVKTSPGAEGLTAAGGRAAGPFVLAAAAYKSLGGGAAPGGETRVVLVGDAAFATNAFLPEQANRDFFLNAVGWLGRARGFVAVRQSAMRGQELALRRSDFGVFRLIIVGPPLLVVAVGLVVWFRRRGL